MVLHQPAWGGLLNKSGIVFLFGSIWIVPCLSSVSKWVLLTVLASAHRVQSVTKPNAQSKKVLFVSSSFSSQYIFLAYSGLGIPLWFRLSLSSFGSLSRGPSRSGASSTCWNGWRCTSSRSGALCSALPSHSCTLLCPAPSLWGPETQRATTQWRPGPR